MMRCVNARGASNGLDAEKEDTVKLKVTIDLSRWAGPTEGGEPLTLVGGVHALDTEDAVLIGALRDAHCAYRRHGTGVVVESEEPAWDTLVRAADEREAADLEAELQRERDLVLAAGRAEEEAAAEEAARIVSGEADKEE